MAATDRVSSGSVVKGAEIIVSNDNPETAFLNPNSILKKNSNGLVIDNYLKGLFFGTFEDIPGDGGLEGLPKNTIQLTDIESVTYESYYTPTKELKYRAILKIRNSSESKQDVIGVDARIYNPNATA